jgi:phosphomannomutase/phosphoglucomutase
MITGSHNPDGWSGFKMANGYSSTLLEKDIQKIYEIITMQNFKTGDGKYFKIDNIKDMYVSALKWRVIPDKRLKIVIDAGNGTAGIFAPAVFRAVGFDVVELFCELDPSFPNHFPNPSDLNSLEFLRKAVLKNNASFGIAIDGDGDRIGVVDNTGKIIPSDRILMLLARQILSEKENAKIVFDVKCSQLLVDDIIAHKGVPIMWKTGHSYIKRKIKEEHADIGGEHSGHIFIVHNYYAFDDAIFAGLRLAEYLSKQTLTFNEIISSTKQYYSSPNIQVNCPDEKKYQVVDKIIVAFEKEYGKENVISINGARIKISNGWGLIRASSNIPALVVMFESDNKDEYLRIKTILKNMLNRFPEVNNTWENDIDPF